MGLENVSIDPKAGKNLLKICMGDIIPKSNGRISRIRSKLLRLVAGG